MEPVFELSRVLSQLASAGNANTAPALNIQAVLRELVAGSVEFLLIGGVAVGYHGHIRATKDVDVVPAPDRLNLERLAGVLERADDRLNVMQQIGDFSLWEELSPMAIHDSVAGFPIKVASYEDLVRLKELAGRPGDLVDLQRLREARDS
jgi:predicted nucleotidyltransferase